MLRARVSAAHIGEQLRRRARLSRLVDVLSGRVFHLRLGRFNGGGQHPVSDQVRDFLAHGKGQRSRQQCHQAGLQHELAQDRRLAESHGQVYGDFLLAAPHPHGEDDAQHHGTACGDGQHQPGHQIANRVQRANGGLVHGVVDGNVIVLGFDALKILHLF